MVSLQVVVPNRCVDEHQYIASVLFAEFLGISFQLIAEDREDIVVRRPGTHAPLLVLPDTFFRLARDYWLSHASLPEQPVRTIDVRQLPFAVNTVTQQLPVLYGGTHNEPHFGYDGQTLKLNIDVFGSSFFLLTRYEELVSTVRDRFERFPATASIAYQEGWLDRPLVNEYVELLWSALSYLWPDLARAEKHFRPILSHDVDWPIVTLDVPWKRVLKSSVGDAVVRKDSRLAAKRLLARYLTSHGKFDRDPGNTFEFIMSQSEKRGLTSAFYFITDHTGGTIDGTYNIDQPWIMELLRSVHVRGHEIGLHPSFNTFRDPVQTVKEFDRLREACAKVGATQAHWGGRQHYLRWENPTTWGNWESAGLHYDSTVGFADQVGFRCGVCYEFPVFDLKLRKPLRLRERPLIVMEGTLFETTSPSYMALPDDEAFQIFDTLVARVRQFSGDFTLLWHNATLISRRQRELYVNCLDRLVT